MKFPAFLRRESSQAAMRERQGQFEKLVADSLRALSQAFSKLADAVDAQRLSRAGYEKQEKFLERMDQKAK
ncbi:MAG: hypothetical protein HYZ28_04980 [Myxococcales bacterium]|nr:hypothetical protein [Myxococcales bacterium]